MLVAARVSDVFSFNPQIAKRSNETELQQGSTAHTKRGLRYSVNQP